MSNKLINLMTSESLQGQAVSARELYDFLGIKTHFKDWFPRMMEYGFEENVDFVPLKNEQIKVSRLNPINYAITLDMAKEISMIQRSEKGKKARQYFIECERQLKETVKPKTRLELAQENLQLIIEAEERESLLLVAQPKADKYDIFMNRDTLQSATQIGQVIGISAVALNKFLATIDVYNSRVKRTKIFKNWFIVDGYGKTIENQGGFSQSLFTPKGLDFIINEYNKKQNE